MDQLCLILTVAPGLSSRPGGVRSTLRFNKSKCDGCGLTFEVQGSRFESRVQPSRFQIRVFAKSIINSNFNVNNKLLGHFCTLNPNTNHLIFCWRSKSKTRRRPFFGAGAIYMICCVSRAKFDFKVLKIMISWSFRVFLVDFRKPCRKLIFEYWIHDSESIFHAEFDYGIHF